MKKKCGLHSAKLYKFTAMAGRSPFLHSLGEMKGKTVRSLWFCLGQTKSEECLAKFAFWKLHSPHSSSYIKSSYAGRSCIMLIVNLVLGEALKKISLEHTLLGKNIKPRFPGTAGVCCVSKLQMTWVAGRPRGHRARWITLYFVPIYWCAESMLSESVIFQSGCDVTRHASEGAPPCTASADGCENRLLVSNSAYKIVHNEATHTTSRKTHFWLEGEL